MGLGYFCRRGDRLDLTRWRRGALRGRVEPDSEDVGQGGHGHRALRRDDRLRAVRQGDRYYIGVGGGITAESDRDFEYEEIWQKAKALLTALKGDTFYYEPYL